MKKPIGLFLVLGLVGAPLQGQTNALDFGADDVNIDFNNGAWSLGWEFNVLSPILVTSLGLYDNGQWRTDRQVGIFSDPFTVLGQTTITGSSTVSGVWRFQAVSPFLLAIGTYRIFGTTGLDNYTWNPDNLFIAPEIEFVRDYWVASPTLEWGTNTDGVEGYIGPNFQFAESVVPEPSTYILVATGLTVIGLFTRNRRRNAAAVN